jgi:molybdate transport system regulatory protein
MLEINCHIIVKRNGLNFLSSAKIELLKEIKQNGSLSRAAKNLKISYQHVWNMIDEMNRVASEPLVLKQRGGINGGGAEVSKYGEQILSEFNQIEAQFQKLAKQVNVEINL